MRIEGPRPTSSPAAGRRADQAASGFAPSQTAAPARSAVASGVSAPPSIEALIALQGDADAPAQRRSRQVSRGTRTLDLLDSLAVGLLEGRLPEAARVELAALREGLEATGEPGLDAVIEEIDVRAAVELAKLERAQLA